MIGLKAFIEKAERPFVESIILALVVTATVDYQGQESPVRVIISWG